MSQAQPVAPKAVDLEPRGEGLKLKEVANRLDKNYSSLRAKKAELGIEGFLAYLQTLAGYPWRFDPDAHQHGLYYPD